jgi:type I restriction enzyme R subunit
MQQYQFRTNFNFMQEDYPFLANIGASAEYYAFSDPAASLIKSRIFGEKISDLLLNTFNVQYNDLDTFNDRLKLIKYNNIIPTSILDLLYGIKQKGNLATHDNIGSTEEALIILQSCFSVAKWFWGVYSKNNIEKIQYKEPENLDATHSLYLLQQEFAELEQKNLLLEKELQSHIISEQEKEDYLNKGYEVANKLDLTEKETRVIIDKQLRQAGWEVDSTNINFKSKGTRPEAGKNLAISEWKTEKGWADYALFVGCDLVGIVEAKRWKQDILSNMSDAQKYSKEVTESNNAKLLGSWGEFRVPFLYASNGRSYIDQLREKSGIWFWDARNLTNLRKPLRGWHSPQDIRDMLVADKEKAENELLNSSSDYLRDKTGLGLRYYQMDAIEAIENIIITKPEQRRALIAMATGTGKTRTTVGLIYRLIKAKRFKRVLFLVDRNFLGQQANDSFTDFNVEDLQAFGDIYDIKNLKTKKSDIDTKIHFATVQGMVRRIFYASDEEQIPTVGEYDCIVVDEAHRGYNLDRDIDDDLIDFKDERDYQSKYKMVLDYFDAFAVGLTATPAINTVNIFGRPVFRYTYRQAVIDGYLIDHEPPYIIKTDRNQKGIKWVKGEKPKAFDREEQRIFELDALEDELKIEVEHFNKKVITEPFNRTVLSELVKYLDPFSDQKTLIFAATDEHADMVVQILKEEFNKAEMPVDDDLIMKITGNTNMKPSPQERINLYKNEKKPNIAVTVDLLTTGIDVPEICNLVFIRKVKSRILYEQMLGRATRLADNVGKEYFKIFDAVNLYETLEEFSTMQPVVTNVKSTFKSLSDELQLIDKDDIIKKQIDQVISKLNRKKGRINRDQQEQFKSLFNNKTPEEFINELKKQKPQDAKKYLLNVKAGLVFLDNMNSVPTFQLISDHPDKVQDVERGYGNGNKPEDYLDNFKKYITGNINKLDALKVVCTKPTELTRKSLRELVLQLDIAGFNVASLNAAWKDAKNEEIAADIISFIRTMAIGDNLLSHEERIKRAFKKVRGAKQWNAIQKRWLERFERQLLKENILTTEDFEYEPFRSDGGYKVINKYFNNELDKVLELINQNLYISA